MLNKFRKAKEREIVRLRSAADMGLVPRPWDGERPSFTNALLGAKHKGDAVAVIAEYKRASPSRGLINAALGPEDVAAMYARGGAAAISVLTETDYFQGSQDYLFAMAAAGPPLLRKDFLFDPVQVMDTASTPASALLLIARMFDNTEDLSEMIALTRNADITPVVEIFDEADLARSREAGATVIQANNRDLDKLVTDLDNGRRLIRDKRDGELWICASGIETHGQLMEMAGLGYDAALVGTSLMQHDDPGAALARLLTGEDDK